MMDDPRRFWEQPGKRFAITLLDGWIRGAEGSGIGMLKQMAKTLAVQCVREGRTLRFFLLV
jgi:hypothetical protein